MQKSQYLIFKKSEHLLNLEKIEIYSILKTKRMNKSQCSEIRTQKKNKTKNWTNKKPELNIKKENTKYLKIW